MEQKRVSFKIAKAIKEAGYNEPCDMYYHIYDDEYESKMSLEATGDGSHSFLNNLNHYRCAAPSVLDVWLWLWREKKKAISIICDEDDRLELNWFVNAEKLTGEFGSFTAQVFFSDPEEAIIAALDYLVDSNLLK